MSHKTTIDGPFHSAHIRNAHVFRLSIRRIEHEVLNITDSTVVPSAWTRPLSVAAAAVASRAVADTVAVVAAAPTVVAAAPTAEVTVATAAATATVSFCPFQYHSMTPTDTSIGGGRGGYDNQQQGGGYGGGGSNWRGGSQGGYGGGYQNNGGDGYAQ